MSNKERTSESIAVKTPKGVGVQEHISLKAHFFSYRTLLSLILAFLILYILVTKINVGETIKILKETNWFLFLVAFISFYLSILTRGLRWQTLLRNVGFHFDAKSVTEILFLSWFANVLIPAKLGDIYRAFLIKRNYRSSFSKTLGTIFTERIFDMAFLLILFSLSGFLTFQEKMPDTMRQLLILCFIMSAVLIIGFLLMKGFSEKIKAIVPNKLANIYASFEGGAVNSLSSIKIISTYSTAIWLLESGRLLFVFLALQIEVDVFVIIFVALASSLLTTLPITPAGLGAVEFAVVAILSSLGVPSNISMSIAILDRLISYWSIMPLGFLTFIVSKKT